MEPPGDLRTDSRSATAQAVRSSWKESGGQLTVHTDVAYVEQAVVLTVAGASAACHTFADSLGNLAAQCSKEAAKDAIGTFDGKRTTVTVGLSVGGSGYDEESITVKK